MFEIGGHYTRNDIHAAIGGGVQPFLPTVKKRVVCACLRARLNPDGPDAILVGDGPNILKTAEWLASQKQHIPVFLKEATNSWKYIGDFKVKGWSKDSAVIKPYAAKAGRTDVRMVVFMEP